MGFSAGLFFSSLILLGIALWWRGLVLDRLRKRVKKAESMVLTIPPAIALTAERNCPVCQREYDGTKMYCPMDGAELIDGPSKGTFSEGMICPTCKRGYSSESRFCPHDSDELVPFGLYASDPSIWEIDEDAGVRVCPTCMHKPLAFQRFCGEDGSELVLLN